MLLSWLLIGFKTEQVVLVVIFLALYYVSAPTRKLITAFSVFIVFWIIFDYMKAFPNYMVNHVHTGDLYELDKGLFGTYAPDGALISVNEYWALHPTTFLDILSGCFYLCWIPVPLGFGVYLFYKKRAGFLPFALTFLFVNLLGFVIYYIYPAAPPWYIRLYGFPVHLSTPGNTAGLQRFDDYFHTGIFHALYAKSSNVFAAMPSLHAAYPLITFYYGLKNRVGWLNLFLGLVVLGIWFAAIYTGHHYVLDVLAGITCALVGIFIFQKILLRTHWFNRFLETFQRLIA
jgi:membrane-associated phospholipid phosphatase